MDADKISEEKAKSLIQLKDNSAVRSNSDSTNENTIIDYDVYESLAANQSASLVLQMLEKMGE